MIYVPEQDVLSRPRGALRLHRDVAVVRPQAGDGWAVRTPDNKLLGVGEQLGELLVTLKTKGPLTKTDLLEQMPPQWQPSDVDHALDAVSKYGLVVADYEMDSTEQKPLWSVDNDGPLILKLCFNRPEAFFIKAAPVVKALRKTFLRWVPLVIAILGIPALLSLAGNPNSTLFQPLTLGTYGALLLALTLTTAIHELAHGLTLTACGGMPHRMGIMLFYFSPAAFCDVTEAWLLPRKDRVAVAFAGIVIQTSIGAIALIANLLLGGEHAFLTWYGASTYLVALSNLIPFLRLDGYVALVGFTNQSGLRQRSIQALRNRVAGIPEPHEPLWVALFGVGCLVTPLVIVWTAVTAIAPNLLRGGAGGRIMLSMLIGFCLMNALVKMIHGLRGLKRTQQIRLFVTGFSAAVLVLLTPIGTTTSLGFQATGSHRAVALTGDAAGSAPVTTGTKVSFHRSGLLTGPALGQGTVVATENCTVPLRAVSPLLSDAQMPPGTCLVVESDVELTPGTTGRITSQKVYQPLARVIRHQLGPVLPGGSLYSDDEED